MIQGHKSWSKTSYSKRRSAMDRTFACVDAAQSKDDLKAFHKQRKEASRALHREHNAYVKGLCKQAGLPIREEKPCREKIVVHRKLERILSSDQTQRSPQPGACVKANGSFVIRSFA